MPIFTPESKMSAPIDMIKALGGIPFNGTDPESKSLNDIIASLARFFEPGMRDLKASYERTPFAQQDNQGLVKGTVNAIGVPFQMGGDVLSSIASHIAEDPDIQSIAGMIAGNAAPQQSQTPILDQTSEQQQAPVASPDKSKDVQDYYKKITEAESMLSSMPTMMQTIFRPQVAKMLSDQGAPSDLVSIYTQHGGAAPAVHQEFQAKMQAGQERPEQALMKMALSKMIETQYGEAMQNRAAFLKAKPDELKGIKTSDGTSVVDSPLIGKNSINIAARDKAMEELYPMPDINQIMNMFAKGGQKSQEDKRKEQAAIEAVRSRPGLGVRK